MSNVNTEIPAINWPYPILRLKPGKEDILSKRHPWIFSGAFSESAASPIVRIADSSGNVLACGTASSSNPLAVRIFRFENAPLDEPFFKERLESAIALRRTLGLDGDKLGCRWVFSEGDGLPGLVIDRYGAALCIQVGTAGLEALRSIWFPVLSESAKQNGIQTIVERSLAGRKEEGLETVNRIVKGSLPGPVTIVESNAKLSVDLLKGQKTGFYLDQREHRLALGRISSGKRVLNAFGYTGAFSIHAGLGGAAEVTTLEISQAALDVCESDWEVNGLDPYRHVKMQGDAFDLMRQLKPESYDCVVIDPPAFAKQRKDLDNAFKAYKDMFRLGARATAPSGMMFCFSCSQYLGRTRFQEAVWTACIEAGKDAQIIAHLGQPQDHPYSINHPEGFYLKGLLLRLSPFPKR